MNGPPFTIAFSREALSSKGKNERPVHQEAILPSATWLGGVSTFDSTIRRQRFAFSPPWKTPFGDSHPYRESAENKKRFDAEVEAIAVKVSWAFEEAAGAVVTDVSRPRLARAAGLEVNPGFDLLSNRSGEGSRGIEVKGGACIGDVELTENEWPKACNQRGRYWLNVAYDCRTPHPRLLRVQDPFGKLVVQAKVGVRRHPCRKTIGVSVGRN